MPSEVVYGTDNVDVRVSWGTNEQGQIQVVSQMTDGAESARRTIGIVNEWLTAAKMDTIDVDRLIAAVEPAFDGWWATLSDWAQVNRLIKALKRARDRQFGSPE